MTEDRFSSISGLLNPRPARTEATIHRITPQPDQPTTPTEPAPTRPSSTTAPKSRQAAGGNRRVVFKLAPDLHARLTAHAKSTGDSYGNTVLDAVEAAHTANAITDLLTDPQHDGSAGTEGMFARVAQRGNATPAITVEIQLRAQAVDQLDRLVDHYQAASRTRLLTAALQHYLRGLG